MVRSRFRRGRNTIIGDSGAHPASSSSEYSFVSFQCLIVLIVSSVPSQVFEGWTIQSVADLDYISTLVWMVFSKQQRSKDDFLLLLLLLLMNKKLDLVEQLFWLNQ